MQKLILVPHVLDQSYWLQDEVKVTVPQYGRRLNRFVVRHLWYNEAHGGAKGRNALHEHLTIQGMTRAGEFMSSEFIECPWECALDIADAINMLATDDIGRAEILHNRTMREKLGVK